MPYTVQEVESYFGPGWDSWPVPEMEPVKSEPWAGIGDCFWNLDITNYPVDSDRTAALADVDVPIGGSAGHPPWQGSTYGMPYQLITEAGPKTTVYDRSRGTWWEWFRLRFPTVGIPLPGMVRREGDPNPPPNSDKHWIGYDQDAGILYETIQMNKGPALFNWGQSEWSIGYTGSGPLARWDCNKRWNEAGQPIGVVASGIPLFPLIPRFDQWLLGINHAMFLALPNYCAGLTPPARGYDGDLVNHPLRAGERLRLKYPTTNPIAKAAAKYGFIVGDRNAWNKGDYKGVAGYTLTQDRRWTTVDLPQWRLTDFEVVVAS
jgi:hypothetical protein